MPYKNQTTDYRKKQFVYEQQIKETMLLNIGGSDIARTETGTEGVEDRTILKGHLSMDNYISAVQVHASDTLEMTNHTVEALCQPSLTICVILEGRIEGTIGDLKYILDASNGPAGYLWAYSTPLIWTRKIAEGMKVSKINISIETSWLLSQLNELDQKTNVIGEILKKPLEIYRWQPSKRAVSLAGQIITPPESSSLVSKFQRESRALDILAESIEAMEMMKSPSLNEDKGKISGNHHLKAQQIRAFIEHHDKSKLTLSTLSAEMGLGINSMQNSFKTAYGMTIMDYIRERLLVTARDAMEREGVTIGQAAFLAGYSSPANFSTAFKRQFGISPSEIIFD